MQRVITYRDKDDKLVVYATAYADEHVIEQVKNCRARYGADARIRTLDADKVSVADN